MKSKKDIHSISLSAIIHDEKKINIMSNIWDIKLKHCLLSQNIKP